MFELLGQEASQNRPGSLSDCCVDCRGWKAPGCSHMLLYSGLKVILATNILACFQRRGDAIDGVGGEWQRWNVPCISKTAPSFPSRLDGFA